MEQKCSKCKKVKDIDQFKNAINGKITKLCLDCRKRGCGYGKKQREGHKKKKPRSSNYRICTECHHEKKFTDFLEDSKMCESCQEKTKNQQQRRRKRMGEETKDDEQLCTVCVKHYPLSEFPVDEDGNTLKYCRKCQKESRVKSITYEKKKKESYEEKKDDVGDGFKLCKYCLTEKPITDFEHPITGEEILRCQECRGRLLKNATKHRKKIVEHFVSLKINTSCIDCGETDIRILEFDHKDPKDKTCIVLLAHSIKMMDIEAGKCEIRCRMCHRIKSHRDGYNCSKPMELWTQDYTADKKRRDKLREFINSFKTECSICGWYDKDKLYCLDFDHLNREEKSFIISSAINMRKSIEEVEKEIKKCRVLCCNCHKFETITQMGYTLYDNIVFE